MNSKTWSFKANNGNLITKYMAYMSVKIRRQQYKYFKKIIKPKSKNKILDVGVTPNEELVDSNFFEKAYPYKNNLTMASVEDCRNLLSTYPDVKFRKIRSNSKLPFKDKSFDVVVSWATLEHIGRQKSQEFFLSECLRVGKKVFITTPNRYFLYDPHTNLLFIHWLPNKYFRSVCRFLGKNFWAEIKNLNLLDVNSLGKITSRQNGLRVVKFKVLNVITSHFLLTKT